MAARPTAGSERRSPACCRAGPPFLDVPHCRCHCHSHCRLLGLDRAREAITQKQGALLRSSLAAALATPDGHERRPADPSTSYSSAPHPTAAAAAADAPVALGCLRAHADTSAASCELRNCCGRIASSCARRLQKAAGLPLISPALDAHCVTTRPNGTRARPVGRPEYGPERAAGPQARRRRQSARQPRPRRRRQDPQEAPQGEPRYAGRRRPPSLSLCPVPAIHERSAG